MPIRRPFNLKQWIDDNRDLLKPPFGNKNLYADAGDYIVMVVGGPNARKDYHWNETEELFHLVEELLGLVPMHARTITGTRPRSSSTRWKATSKWASRRMGRRSPYRSGKGRCSCCLRARPTNRAALREPSGW